MILVGQYDSPFTRRVAVSLHLLGMPFARNTDSVFAQADAMRKISPLGRVPMLILAGGEVLIESSAVLDYLDEQAGPGRALLPRGGAERRTALRSIAIATGGMEKAVAIVYERVLRPAGKRYEPWLERCQTQLAGALAFLETEQPSPFVNGGALTQPDITTACLVAFLKLRVPDAFPASKFPKLEKLAATAEAHPAFVATRPSDTDTPPGAFKA